MKKAIFTSANGNWLDKVKICLQSLLDHKSDDVDLFLFTDQKGFTGVSIEEVKACIEPHGITVHQFDIDLSGLPVIDTAIHETALSIRFVAPQYLRDLGYDMALHLDADIIQTKPLYDSFWNGKNGAVVDGLGRRLWKNTIRTLKSQTADKSVRYHIHTKTKFEYFNAGMIRMNLHDPVWDQVLEKYKTFRVENKWNMIFADQCFLNLLLLGNVEYLDFGHNLHLWNMGSRRSDRSTVDNPWKSDVYEEHQYMDVILSAAEKSWFIHYAGAMKPWRKQCPDNLAFYWGDAGKKAISTFGISQEAIEQCSIASNNVPGEYSFIDVRMPIMKTDRHSKVDLFSLLQ